MIWADESSALSPGTNPPRISHNPTTAVRAPDGSFSTVIASGRL